MNHGGFFETFYQSELQHPILLWCANLIGTAIALLALRHRSEGDPRKIRTLVLFWALVSALDAWLSANVVFGMGTLPAPLSSVIPFLFVWAGDFRIFFAMEDRLLTLRSVAACFVVPVLAGLLTLGREPRILFLVYEMLFLIWIFAYGRLTGTDQKPQSRRIRNFSFLFYSLWVLADVLILTLPEPFRDLGFAVRVVPNVLYYGGFGYICARVWGKHPG